MVVLPLCMKAIIQFLEYANIIIMYDPEEERVRRLLLCAKLSNIILNIPFSSGVTVGDGEVDPLAELERTVRSFMSGEKKRV